MIVAFRIWSSFKVFTDLYCFFLQFKVDLPVTLGKILNKILNTWEEAVNI